MKHKQDELIKALKIHTGVLDMPCEECPYNCDAHDEICLGGLVTDVLALINSQEQKIKELTEENERVRADTIEEYRQKVNTKMGKHTHLLGKEYVQRILREVKKKW